jgi:hypothetical protein
VRAPDQPAPALDEIVQDIVEIILEAKKEVIGDPEAGLDFNAVQANYPDAADVIEVSVRASIRTLREIDAFKAPFPHGYRQPNLEGLKTIRDLIADLQQCLGKLPPAALFLLFAWEESGLPPWPGAGVSIPSTENQRKAKARIQRAGALLAALRARCDVLMNVKPGEHASVLYRKQHVAIEAVHLLQGFWIKNVDADKGALPEVAGLLYRAVTGKTAEDLEHHLRTALGTKNQQGRKPSKKSDFAS